MNEVPIVLTYGHEEMEEPCLPLICLYFNSHKHWLKLFALNLFGICLPSGSWCWSSYLSDVTGIQYSRHCPYFAWWSVTVQHFQYKPTDDGQAHLSVSQLCDKIVAKLLHSWIESMKQNDNRESQRAIAIVCPPFVILRQLHSLFFQRGVSFFT